MALAKERICILPSLVRVKWSRKPLKRRTKFLKYILNYDLHAFGDMYKIAKEGNAKDIQFIGIAYYLREPVAAVLIIKRSRFVNHLNVYVKIGYRRVGIATELSKLAYSKFRETVQVWRGSWEAANFWDHAASCKAIPEKKIKARVL